MVVGDKISTAEGIEVDEVDPFILSKVKLLFFELFNNFLSLVPDDIRQKVGTVCYDQFWQAFALQIVIQTVHLFLQFLDRELGLHR